MDVQIVSVEGQKARGYINDLAALRIQVFKDFPYLYDGDVDYEKKYLNTYFKSKTGRVFLALDGKRVVGASTCVLAVEEEEAFKAPLVKAGYDPKKVLYFGESILLSRYRGQGIGKSFMKERIEYARDLTVKHCAFLSVSRERSHPKRPKNYRPLDSFWKDWGFSKQENLHAFYEWKEIGESSRVQKANGLLDERPQLASLMRVHRVPNAFSN